eukprot:TRINITY_DN38647_c0_g1_i1.p1 TRINITY_DN38647_c0_g1~~TRINITY_DN38647_c0_g1_i1.p1  ORF type:complete len:788 (+),score=85.60 TRINITY_DN38647_c0_g1_i1:156-2519(+)
MTTYLEEPQPPKMGYMQGHPTLQPVVTKSRPRSAQLTPLHLFQHKGVKITPSAVSGVIGRKYARHRLPKCEKKSGTVDASVGGDEARAMLAFDFIDRINDEVVQNCLPFVDETFGKRLGLLHDTNRLSLSTCSDHRFASASCGEGHSNGHQSRGQVAVGRCGVVPPQTVDTFVQLTNGTSCQTAFGGGHRPRGVVAESSGGDGIAEDSHGDGRRGGGRGGGGLGERGEGVAEEDGEGEGRGGSGGGGGGCREVRRGEEGRRVGGGAESKASGTGQGELVQVDSIDQTNASSRASRGAAHKTCDASAISPREEKPSDCVVGLRPESVLSDATTAFVSGRPESCLSWSGCRAASRGSYSPPYTEAPSSHPQCADDAIPMSMDSDNLARQESAGECNANCPNPRAFDAPQGGLRDKPSQLRIGSEVAKALVSRCSDYRVSKACEAIFDPPPKEEPLKCSLTREPAAPGAALSVFYGAGASRVRRSGQCVGGTLTRRSGVGQARRVAQPTRQHSSRRDPLTASDDKHENRKKVCVSETAKTIDVSLAAEDGRRDSGLSCIAEAVAAGSALDHFDELLAIHAARGEVAAVASAAIAAAEKGGPACASAALWVGINPGDLRGSSWASQRSRQTPNQICPFSNVHIDASNSVELRCGHRFASEQLRLALQATNICHTFNFAEQDGLTCPLCGDQDITTKRGLNMSVTTYSADAEGFVGKFRKDMTAKLRLPWDALDVQDADLPECSHEPSDCAPLQTHGKVFEPQNARTPKGISERRLMFADQAKSRNAIARRE